MKLLLDDRLTKGCKLNANEACIFAAVLKCTRAGRGWYGNYRDLAAAMPFVISYVSVYRAVQKLLNLGLIERREEKLFALLHNETEPLQNETTLLQNETTLLQNVLPPNNPPINNNNMNEKEKEQQRALCARDCEKQQDSLFEKFWNYFNPDAKYNNRLAATKTAFMQRSHVAQQALVEAAQECVHQQPDPQPNPYFFVADFPEPKPAFLSGEEQDKLHQKGVTLVQVRYNGKYLVCTDETAQLFNLEITRLW